MRIIILVDNTSTRPGLATRHGLAMLIESGTVRILFDTGPDNTIVSNAAALNIPLYPLDAIVLSHGHMDHTGGLAAVLEIVGPTKVIAQPGVFDQTFSGPAPGELRNISLPLPRQDYEHLGARFELSQRPVELGPGLITTGHIAPIHLEPEQRLGLWREHAAGVYPDDFRDDCSLLLEIGKYYAVITGCAHAGLTNILCKALTILPERPPQILLGGLHLGNMEDRKVVQIAREVADMGICDLMPCHCTGERATQVLRTHFPGSVIPIGAGSVIRAQDKGAIEVRDAVPTN